jgi:hypothetical protein
MNHLRALREKKTVRKYPAIVMVCGHKTVHNIPWRKKIIKIVKIKYLIKTQHNDNHNLLMFDTVRVNYPSLIESYRRTA